jgi:dTDP-4-amino-4,6-dideoxygalactose transaminase
MKQNMGKAVYDWDYLSGLSGEGPIVLFEEKLSDAVGGNYAIAMTNATSALLTSLMVGGVGRGDEVILPSYTWPQTLTPVILSGATPVFADIEDHSYSISVESAKKLITKKTKAIIAVHLYGMPADVVALEKLCNDRNCLLICDAAQGFGASQQGKSIGAYGDLVAFSFGRSKLFSVGEGGALICKTRELYEKAVAFSQHPLRVHKNVDDAELRNSVDGISMNFRMHPLIAALANGQITGLLQAGYLGRIRERFVELCSALEILKRPSVLPGLPEGASPSGVCLPLLIRGQSDLDKCREIVSGLGMETYEGGLHSALHLSGTVQKRNFPFLQRDSDNLLFQRHATHRKGSCPNAEKRTSRTQFFVAIN